MKDISEENIPCWYRMLFDNLNMTLTVMLHTSAFTKISSITKDRIENLQNDFIFNSFAKGENGHFGFNNCFSISRNDPWILLQTPLPAAHKEPCEYCKGNPQDYLGGHCLFCQNEGSAYQRNTYGAHAICASLSLLFRKIFYQEQELTTDRFQIMTVLTSCLSESMENFAMSGKVSPSGKASFAHCNPTAVEEAMKSAYQYMTGDFESQKYRVKNEDGEFHLTCPGNACGIIPTESSKEGGYNFQSHNMGSPIQQLTILVGLATLCSLAYGEK